MWQADCDGYSQHLTVTMKNKLIYPLIATVLLAGAACRGDGKSGSGAGEHYETVQEGSAAGVTSTIHGPGEVVPPLTGTNADTTTAFTLDPNVAGAPAQPGTIAGTLPPPAYPSTQTPYPSGGAPAGSYVPPRESQQPSGMTTRTQTGISRTPVQRQAPPQQQPPTETTEPVSPPPATDTTATQEPPPPPAQTTTTPPPPPPAEPPKKEQEQKPPADSEDDESGQTDTAAPPPPPPPAR
jgi:hypothetical protein